MSEGGDFPSLLKAFRERSGLSQNGLADRCGRDPGTINRLESGKRAPVNREMVEEIARALSLTREEGDALLASAGHLPIAYERVGLADRDLSLVADILSDDKLSPSERAEFRLMIRLAARRWRDVPLAPSGALDGAAESQTPIR